MWINYFWERLILIIIIFKIKFFVKENLQIRKVECRPPPMKFIEALIPIMYFLIIDFLKEKACLLRFYCHSNSDHHIVSLLWGLRSHTQDHGHRTPQDKVSKQPTSASTSLSATSTVLMLQLQFSPNTLSRNRTVNVVKRVKTPSSVETLEESLLFPK